LGQGYGVIQEALGYGSHATMQAPRAAFSLLLGVFFAKTVATALTVGSGGSGGIFGPSLVAGGALGGATGIVFSALLPDWDVPVGSMTLVGMVAFFGCAAKTPISTILMVSEMTGNPKLLVPSMFVCIIAYMLSRKVSLYRSQLPNRFEAPAHRGNMISGVLRNVRAEEVLKGKDGGGFKTVAPHDTLDVLTRMLHDTAQGVIPVVEPATGVLCGVVSRRDIAAVADSDAMLRQTLMVEDLHLTEHALATEKDTVQTILANLDANDAEGMVVVSRYDRNRILGVITHNDIAETYQREISAAR